MKFKSLKLTAVILSICFLSFFAANNALAAYAYSGAKVYGISIIKMSGTGSLVISSPSYVSNYAQANENESNIDYNANATSSTASALSKIYVDPGDPAHRYGIQSVQNTNTIMEGYSNIDDFHNGEASSSSNGGIQWNFTQNGGNARYIVRVYADLWTSGSAECHPGAYADGNAYVDVYLTGGTLKEGGGSLWAYNEVEYPEYWGAPVTTRLFQNTMSLTAGQEGTLSIYFESYGDAACPVPLPASFLLLAPGLIGLAGLRKRINK
ncbi:MAG: VPLPA-CTERM sorting domain-containing protein [Proteobacteria bacterium]|nr:VPLPA-CTERM sorting domain-containing protein [Pseudomonadota bacterium]